MNTLKQLKETLLPILDMTNLSSSKFLIVGSAAEYLANLGVVFGDVDIYVSPETFKRLVDEEFKFEIKHETETPTRVIRIGMVDIIEHKGEWLNKEKTFANDFPVLTQQNMLEWRLWMGRSKDQLKAWQIIRTLYKPLQELLFLNPPLAVLNGVIPTIKYLEKFQDRLMEMRNEKA